MTTADDFLAHYGIKGMRWGVRKPENRDARTQRLKSGTANRRDKLIREADLDGGRTQAIRKGELKGYTKGQKAAFAFIGGLMAARGALVLKDIKKHGW